VISRTQRVILRTAAIAAGSLVGFAVFQTTFRALETHMAAAIVRLLGSGNRAPVLARTSIVVLPFHGAPFRAIITPSCSSLASVLALGCLVTMAPTVSRRRRLMAAAAAIGLVVFGNILRIAGSVGVGLVAGRASLVLFHDWVGGLLTFMYTVGGYLLMPYLLLPNRRAASPEAAHQTEVLVGV